MAICTLFKECSECGSEIPLTDGHSKCLFCLGETHNTTACGHCRAFPQRVQRERMVRLKAFVWEMTLSHRDMILKHQPKTKAVFRLTPVAATKKSSTSVSATHLTSKPTTSAVTTKTSSASVPFSNLKTIFKKQPKQAAVLQPTPVATPKKSTSASANCLTSKPTTSAVTTKTSSVSVPTDCSGSTYTRKLKRPSQSPVPNVMKKKTKKEKHLDSPSPSPVMMPPQKRSCTSELPTEKPTQDKKILIPSPRHNNDSVKTPRQDKHIKECKTSLLPHHCSLGSRTQTQSRSRSPSRDNRHSSPCCHPSVSSSNGRGLCLAMDGQYDSQDPFEDPWYQTWTQQDWDQYEKRRKSPLPRYRPSHATAIISNPPSDSD